MNQIDKKTSWKVLLRITRLMRLAWVERVAQVHKHQLPLTSVR